MKYFMCEYKKFHFFLSISQLFLLVYVIKQNEIYASAVFILILIYSSLSLISHTSLMTNQNMKLSILKKN